MNKFQHNFFKLLHPYDLYDLRDLTTYILNNPNEENLKTTVGFLDVSFSKIFSNYGPFSRFLTNSLIQATNGDVAVHSYISAHNEFVKMIKDENTSLLKKEENLTKILNNNGFNLRSIHFPFSTDQRFMYIEDFKDRFYSYFEKNISY